MEMKNTTQSQATLDSKNKVDIRELTKHKLVEVEAAVRRYKVRANNADFVLLLKLTETVYKPYYTKWSHLLEWDEYYSVACECLLDTVRTYDTQYTTFYPRFQRNLTFFVSAYYTKIEQKHNVKYGSKGNLLYQYVSLDDEMREGEGDTFKDALEQVPDLPDDSYDPQRKFPRGNAKKRLAAERGMTFEELQKEILKYQGLVYRRSEKGRIVARRAAKKYMSKPEIKAKTAEYWKTYERPNYEAYLKKRREKYHANKGVTRPYVRKQKKTKTKKNSDS